MKPGRQAIMATIHPIHIQQSFDQLQTRLVPMWQMIGRTDLGGPIEEANTIIVIPSMTVEVEMNIADQQAYEERFLFMLLLLRQPNLRVIYATSLPVDQQIVDYYLGILPSVTVNNARKRLFMVSTGDAGSKPLIRKLLERPRLLEHIRSLVQDLDRAHLVPYITTDLEREVALRLDIPMYAADPRFFAFGTKSGCRRIFAEENVPHPLGHENLTSLDDLIRAIQDMRLHKDTIQKVIVKLNEGVSGYGNATVDLDHLPPPGDASEGTAIQERLRSMRFEASELNYDFYIHKLAKQGGIVEELISGEEVRSPSSQLRITPTGEVEQLSTHDQILGGPSGQVYLGARFPADVEYGPLIMRQAKKIGDRLAREGIVGRFAVDFIVVRKPGEQWQPYAIEVNLRKGGTTHPFLTLQYLTDGMYDPHSGVFKTALGHPKYYVASDHVSGDRYTLLTTDDLLDLVSQHRLHYNHTLQRGIVLHMLSAVTTHGFFGLTAIGDSPAGADALYRQFIDLLVQEVGEGKA
jgi:hypothetical protein